MESGCPLKSINEDIYAVGNGKEKRRDYIQDDWI